MGPSLRGVGARAAVVVLSVAAVTGWGVAAGLGLALAVGRDEPRSSLGALAEEDTDPGEIVVPQPVEPGVPDVDTYEVTVHTDGCGVIRTEGPGGEDLPSLTWSVTDADGFQVLERNALGETHYRYFVGGTYEVVLEAWGDGSYVPVSNTVTITC